MSGDIEYSSAHGNTCNKPNLRVQIHFSEPVTPLIDDDLELVGCRLEQLRQLRRDFYVADISLTIADAPNEGTTSPSIQICVPEGVVNRLSAASSRKGSTESNAASDVLKFIYRHPSISKTHEADASTMLE